MPPSVHLHVTFGKRRLIDQSDKEREKVEDKE